MMNLKENTDMQISDLAVLTAGVITSRVLIGEKNDLSIDSKDSSYGKTIKVLVPKAIHDGKVDHSLLAVEKQSREISPDYLTQEGDIVMKFSSPYDSCLITDKDEGLLIPSFCCKIRIKDFNQIDKFFLLAYLCSGRCKTELKNKCFGSVMAITKKSDVMKIEVPVFSIEKQKNIGKRFQTVQALREKLEEYNRLENERLDAVFGGNV